MQDPSVQIGGLGAIGSTSWAAGTCGSSASVAANMAIRAGCDWRMPVRATPSGKRLRNAWLAATSPGAAVRAASHSGQRQRRCSRSSGSSWKRGQSPHRPHPCCVTRSVTPLPERISRRAPAASGIKDPLSNRRIAAHRSTPATAWANSALRAATDRHWARCHASIRMRTASATGRSAGRHPRGAVATPG
jgi:hypothetical protein